MTKITTLIAELEKNRTAIDRALSALREIEGGAAVPAVRGVGRPPKSASAAPAAPAAAAGPKKRRRLSAEGRARIAEAARARWARVNAEKDKSKK